MLKCGEVDYFDLLQPVVFILIFYNLLKFKSYIY